MDRYHERQIDSIFALAAFQYNIRLWCIAKGCGHARVIEGHQFWWLFVTKRWGDEPRNIAKHFFCGECWRRTNGQRWRPHWTRTQDAPTGEPYPHPPEHEWKRAIRRYR